jgi:hypothetical protein
MKSPIATMVAAIQSTLQGYIKPASKARAGIGQQTGERALGGLLGAVIAGVVEGPTSPEPASVHETRHRNPATVEPG